jgi:hypothetical protein
LNGFGCLTKLGYSIKFRRQGFQPSNVEDKMIAMSLERAISSSMLTVIRGY